MTDDGFALLDEARRREFLLSNGVPKLATEYSRLRGSVFAPLDIHSPPADWIHGNALNVDVPVIRLSRSESAPLPVLARVAVPTYEYRVFARTNRSVAWLMNAWPQFATSAMQPS